MVNRKKIENPLTHEDVVRAAEAGNAAFEAWLATRLGDIMKYKVEGEAADGSYIDGLWFETKEDAQREIWLLSTEFPENNYWWEEESDL